MKEYEAMSDSINTTNQERITEASAFVPELFAATGQRIIGQSQMLERLLVGLLANGHVLLEGLPGLAKTLAIKTLAEAVGGSFSRIQFTPDLLPADIVGTMVYNPGKNDFFVRKGPVFANFVLADEINRAPAKVQSALLESMQERQVTIGNNTYALEAPFLVLATQNPIEQEGTYPLPEAQADRFMLKVRIGYPSKTEEQEIIRLNLGSKKLPPLQQVLTPQQITEAMAACELVYLDEKVEQYILDLVFATRYPADYGLGDTEMLLRHGASPRASIALAKASKAYAFVQGRSFVTPEDVQALSVDIMGHRLGLSYEAEAEGISEVDLVERIIARVKIP